MHRIQNRVATVSIATALSLALVGGSFAVFTPRAHAASNEEVKALITSLFTKIASLQALFAQSDGTKSKTFSIGDSVVTSDTLKVRGEAGVGGALIGVKTPAVSGKLLYGPKVSGGYTWWYVEFEDNAVDGWVAQNWLSKSTSDTANSIINVYEVGTAQITAPMKAPTGSAVSIRADAFNPNWKPTYRYVLHFGDGTSTLVPKKTDTKAAIDTTHTYKKVGTYKITLTYTDWGSTDPNDDIQGLTAMRDVSSRLNQVAATDSIIINTVTDDGLDQNIDTKSNCTVTTDRTAYKFNDTIELTWNSEGVDQLEFILTNDSKINYLALGSPAYKKGNALIGATFTGTEVVKMRTIPKAGETKVSECSTSFMVSK